MILRIKSNHIQMLKNENKKNWQRIYRNFLITLRKMRNNHNTMLFIWGIVLAVTVSFAACQSKEDYPVMKDFQQSISKLSSVAERVDNDTESLWAYNTVSHQ